MFFCSHRYGGVLLAGYVRFAVGLSMRDAKKIGHYMGNMMINQWIWGMNIRIVPFKMSNPNGWLNRFQWCDNPNNPTSQALQLGCARLQAIYTNAPGRYTSMGPTKSKAV
jgi:hypothetical protein